MLFLYLFCLGYACMWKTNFCSSNFLFCPFPQWKQGAIIFSDIRKYQVLPFNRKKWVVYSLCGCYLVLVRLMVNCCWKKSNWDRIGWFTLVFCCSRCNGLLNFNATCGYFVDTISFLALFRQLNQWYRFPYSLFLFSVHRDIYIFLYFDFFFLCVVRNSFLKTFAFALHSSAQLSSFRCSPCVRGILQIVQLADWLSFWTSLSRCVCCFSLPTS